MKFDREKINLMMKNVGWISIGLGLASILIKHFLKIIPFIGILTLIIAGVGLLFGVFGLSDPDKRQLSIAGIATCVIAGITHFGAIWIILLLAVTAYLVFFRKSKKQSDPNEIYNGEDGRFLDN